jgi:hypothetical protein
MSLGFMKLTDKKDGLLKSLLLGCVLISSYAFSQNEKDFTIGDIFDREITVEKLLERATEPSQEATESVTEQNLQLSEDTKPDSELFKDISFLSSDATFETLIQDAEKQRQEYLAKQIETEVLNFEQLGSVENLIQTPASPLSAVFPQAHHKLEDLHAEHQHTKPSVGVLLEKNAVNLNVKEITASVGDKLPFYIQENGEASKALKIFIIDPSIMSLNQKSRTLTAEREGVTRMILTHGDLLTEIYIRVGKTEEPIQVSREPRVISNLWQNEALIANSEGPIEKETTSITPEKTSRNKKSVKKTSRTSSQFSLVQDSFGIAVKALPYETEEISFQVIDSRTNDTSKKIEPISGVDVHIVGSEYTNRSGDLGRLPSVEVPKHASLMLNVKDPFQRYHSSVIELPNSVLNTEAPIPVTLLEQSTYEAYLQIAKIGYNENHSSICAEVRDLQGKPLSGITVSLVGWKDIKPYYFDHYGYLNPQTDRTSDRGRFCFFDLEPGPFGFAFQFENGQVEGPVPLTLFAGSHLESKFELGDKVEVNAALAVTPSAFEMLTGGNITDKEFRPTDYANLVSLGSYDDYWTYDADSVELRSTSSFYEGRSYFRSVSSEFEDAVYRMDNEEDTESIDLVVPMFPNGFLQKISNESQVIQNENKGSVIVNHGAFERDAKLVHSITLLDENSKEVGDKITLDTEAMAATLFFNVAPGTYTVLVKNADGTSLSYDTVLVYESTLSYVRTGSPLYRIQKVLTSDFTTKGTR